MRRIVSNQVSPMAKLLLGSESEVNAAALPEDCHANEILTLELIYHQS